MTINAVNGSGDSKYWSTMILFYYDALKLNEYFIISIKFPLFRALARPVKCIVCVLYGGLGYTVNPEMFAAGNVYCFEM